CRAESRERKRTYRERPAPYGALRLGRNAIEIWYSSSRTDRASAGNPTPRTTLKSWFNRFAGDAAPVESFAIVLNTPDLEPASRRTLGGRTDGVSEDASGGGPAEFRSPRRRMSHQTEPSGAAASERSRRADGKCPGADGARSGRAMSPGPVRSHESGRRDGP